MRSWPALAALAFAGCVHRAPPAPQAAPHYVVGPAYQLGGTWRYPQEQFQYDGTGLAERLADRTGLTADGEAFDPSAMTGAHPTLQLPAIVDVTNLDNGRQVRVRLNDRGPAAPGRVLGLSPRAAELLGLPARGAIPVRIELDSEASQALRDRLGGGPKGITAAPVTSVTSEALPAPGQAARPRARVATSSVPGATASASTALDRLPETVRMVPVQPGQLWVRAGRFTRPRYAETLKNRIFGLPVRVERERGMQQPGYVVMAGPFASIADADAALDQVLASGLTDATIVVE